MYTRRASREAEIEREKSSPLSGEAASTLVAQYRVSQRPGEGEGGEDARPLGFSQRFRLCKSQRLLVLKAMGCTVQGYDRTVLSPKSMNNRVNDEGGRVCVLLMCFQDVGVCWCACV